MSESDTLLSREAILAVDDLVVEKLDVPEWGGSLYVRVMSGRARDAFDAAICRGDTDTLPPDYRARLAAACISDEQGTLLFEAADIELLTKKSIGPLGRVCRLAARLNGLREEDVEALAKNSDGGRSD